MIAQFWRHLLLLQPPHHPSGRGKTSEGGRYPCRCEWRDASRYSPCCWLPTLASLEQKWRSAPHYPTDHVLVHHVPLCLADQGGESGEWRDFITLSLADWLEQAHPSAQTHTAPTRSSQCHTVPYHTRPDWPSPTPSHPTHHRTIPQRHPNPSQPSLLNPTQTQPLHDPPHFTSYRYPTPLNTTLATCHSGVQHTNFNCLP